MSHPFSDFVDKIAKDDAALRRFVADPDGDPEAAALTPAQKTALLSGDDAQLKAALLAENPELLKQEAAQADAAQAPAPLIGWNMAVLEGKIQVLKAPAP
jgi:hypothetical protein